MNQEKTARFSACGDLLMCPVCGGALTLDSGSLRCENRHCFDLSKYGYVNLYGGKSQSRYYSRETFSARSRILENGYYGHVLNEVRNAVNRAGTVNTLLDVGCGEGYYSRMLTQSGTIRAAAFDLSRDAVQLAAKADTLNSVLWFVGDLAHIPVRTGSMDCVLDVFTPANYAEFSRVLKESGVLIKVIPGEEHVKELRALARENLENKDYSNGSVVECFQEHFMLLERRKVSRTFELPSQDAACFAEMTPLLFGIEKASLDLSRLKHLTVEAEILIGKTK